MNVQLDNSENKLSTEVQEKFPITSIVKECKFFGDLPDKETLEKKKKTIYIVDSRDRNMDLYPDPSNYKIDLCEEFTDIKEIELINVQMPRIAYTINNNNDQLHVWYGAEEAKLTLLHGTYEKGEDLAKSIETTLNNGFIFGEDLPKIKVDYITRLHKLVFRTVNLMDDKDRLNINGLLAFNFKGSRYPYQDGERFETCLPENSCGEVLGFRPKIYDMFIGVVALNEIDHETKGMDQLLENCCPGETEKVYYMRPLNGHIKSHLKIPHNPTKQDHELVKYVETLYLRRVDGPDQECDFIKIKVFNEYNCLERETNPGWLVTANGKYQVPHGEYEVFVDYIISEDIIELKPHKYLLLQIPKCHRFGSNDTVTKSSFAKVPFQQGEFPFHTVNGIGNIKSFNPTLGSLNQLHIKFYPYKKRAENYTKTTFDFAGGEHVLMFAFIHYKQALKYGT